ncbi:sugar ABC transporter substrate-binding protein [Alkalihalobacillus alcalophilus ATCC 27647 = CGMCC 1.3604]|uniref:Sugar ABC transporter substrate-binding protein n=1 Tax=Alkalihalobacillus alcalophilus ATCC 27647 = CGMCC 1.3604 TaxID=1218173 RepID=A0A094WFJ3_ALKAL|nr:sugar ABC transporter substrate-binding protein [Alkalihalobacillus alcalophilus]KGA96549.1 sugar ABC transporter substrate-binding protein [Alkalihalobacillus alcalophilus ATCC 27647 = CGMCC 1.3604]MED1564143.1 sugar ABC transporter substrate-binding protein [Alkalihalobacillus alcalophilus]THG91846.1 sugar ABC transporter substrate-binding protein [Alkalihalobacillus alcalophilus ATCC 27647 = CGMCC 1.3604]
MRKGKWRLGATVALLTAVLLVGCSSNDSNDSTNGQVKADDDNVSFENVPERFANGEGAKIKVVRKIGGDDHTAQFLAGAQEEAEALGFEVDVFTANGDSARFHDALTQDVDKYDGFIISHGDDEATVATVQELREKGKSVVAFDSLAELQEIEGVTLTSQDDEALADLALGQLVEDYGGEANIVYLWVDGFAPMVRRDAVYKQFLEQYPGLNELERFGVATDDTSVQTQNAVAAMLNKYPQGEIDAIFATWDAFAIGAAQAIREAGRDEVKIYGIDVSNADLQEIQNEASTWSYTAAVDPKLIGAVNVRILAKKLVGEETPETFDLEASLISQEDLLQANEPVNMINLAEIITSWGESDAFEEDWMLILKDYYGK